MKILYVGIVLVNLVSVSYAWDIKDNPDRYISVGLHSSSSHLNGSQSDTFIGTPESANTFTQGERKNLSSTGFDVRVPITKLITISVGYDKLWENGTSHRPNSGISSYEGLNGDKLEFSMRLYLH